MSALWKIAVGVSLLAVLGLPVLVLWKALVLLGAWLILIYSDLRPTPTRVSWALAVMVAVTLVRSILPAAAIEEGHNIFLVTNGGTVLRNGLPPAIYDNWQRAFVAQYPLDKDPLALWHTAEPETLYAGSSDALWRPARYSRVVDTIAFQNLGEFRGGFANDDRYNFFGGDTMTFARAFQVDLPFFVTYEFSPASVGSTLYWRGSVFWPADGDRFDKLTHSEEAGRTIAPADVGRKAYALNLPAPASARFWEKVSDEARPGALAMRLELRPGLAAALIARETIGLLGLFGVFTILVARINLKRLGVAVALTTAGLAIVLTLIHFSDGKYLGADYPPHGGGDDGLTHESTGRKMASALMNGHPVEALRGGQSVYWDTPGMRHFRAGEKVLFGDTNLGYLLLMCVLPYVVFLTIRQLAGGRWAAAGALFFLLSPSGALSLTQYVQYAKLGYAEAVAFGLLLVGLFLFMRAQPRWGGERNLVHAFFGGACLAGAMFARPNLALVAPVIGVFFVAASWRSGDYRTMLAGMAGLGCALWMPFHNYAYGDAFVLISTSGTSMAIELTPPMYVRAAQDLVTTGSSELAPKITRQVGLWLQAQPRFPVALLERTSGSFLALRLITLAIALFVAIRSIRRSGALAMLAGAAVAAQLPMLFVMAAAFYRYAMIGWDLCAIVTIAAAADWWQTSPAAARRRAA